MVPEAPLVRTELGLAPADEGWFVVNARDARWQYREGRGARVAFEGEIDFPQVGVSIFALTPGEPIGMYHSEADQEDFLVVSGAALLIVEGEERPLRPWDFVHCPARTLHIIVATGDSPCVVVAVGARAHKGEAGSIRYPVDDVARRRGAGVDEETTEPRKAYESIGTRVAVAYRDGWLP